MAGAIIVLVSGKRGAGKDHFAALVSAASAARAVVHVVPTAYQPKRFYCMHHDCDLDRLLRDREYKEKHREGLIAYSERERAVRGADIWIQRAVLEYARLQREHKHERLVIVVPDLRFRIEHRVVAEFVARHSDAFQLVTVRIDVDTDVRLRRVGGHELGQVDTHASETELDDFDEFDVRIANNGTHVQDVALRALAHAIEDM